MKIHSRNIAMTIAGSDSGGGAGVQADLKTFAAFRVHGVSAFACLTAQNPKTVLAAHPVPPKFLLAQFEAVFSELPPQAAKTGMLYSEALIKAVAEWWSNRPECPLVVDPVMISTSGSPLLKPSARRALIASLLPKAALVTPNLHEAEAILLRSIRTHEDLRSAARELHELCGCAALMKGGHLGSAQAVDFFFDGKTELLLASPFVRGISTHGTGCAYSAAIAACLAKGKRLPSAVSLAKDFIGAAIAQSFKAGGHWVLNHFPKLP
jgi:hydroxymethylpyrimidine/phosphomethylpyrimidine kinase